MATTSGGDSRQTLAGFAIQAGPEAGQELPVRLPVISIGRGSQNDLVLSDDSVSNIHARLEYDDGGWRLTDLDSTNGTFVEGTRLLPNEPTPLPYGSNVRFGGMRLEFQRVEDADPEAARATYTPPPPSTPVAQRKQGFRLPVWFVALLLLVAGVLIWLLLDLSASSAPVEPAAEAVSLLLLNGPPLGP